MLYISYVYIYIYHIYIYIYIIYIYIIYIYMYIHIYIYTFNLRGIGFAAFSITSFRRMIDSGAAVEQHIETEFLEKETEEPWVMQQIPWLIGWISI